ncbi:hypothetical protein KW797_04290, partial [Candidatus Parcubacteria bacterium]|nr:hypothetical protein [Candidatus Parcubacteria bacterium]
GEETTLVPPTPVPAPVATPKPQITMPEKIYEFSKSCLGKDIATTQNELGCAEAVSYVFNHVGVQDFPKNGFLSTLEFHIWLKKNAQEVAEPSLGDIIISPTGSSSKKATHGHIGIVARHGILSNNSMNGLWQEYYTQESWKAYYGSKLGFPVFFYRISNSG